MRISIENAKPGDRIVFVDDELTVYSIEDTGDFMRVRFSTMIPASSRPGFDSCIGVREGAASRIEKGCEFERVS